MSTTGSLRRFFATCPKGIESLLYTELETLGGQNLKLTVAGVAFDATLRDAYRVCLWSRLANRLLLPLARFHVTSSDQLYEGVQQVDWLDHLRSTGTLLVDFNGTGPGIKNTHFGALRVKDAVVDQIRSLTGNRPSIEKQGPDLRINVHLNKGVAQLSIDLSGDSLHRRGYRLKGGAAPLKENLAAAILYRCGWPALAAQGRPFVDPMCGSGTLLTEAALMAADIAPGLARHQFGFERWPQHDSQAWQEELALARERRDIGVRACKAELHGYDANAEAIAIADSNIRSAGVESLVRVSRRELSELKPLTHKPGLEQGLLLTNPPYGERLSDAPVVIYLYKHLGSALRSHFVGWTAGVFTGNPELGKAVGLRTRQQYKLFNGAIPSKLLIFAVQEENFYRDGGDHVQDVKAPVLDSGGEMFANRLKKNLRQLEKWARRSDISCYRVYDADMPEYAVAIDRYADWVHVQEYAAPSSIDPDKAQHRLDMLLSILPGALGVDPARIAVKQRRRQSGTAQYQRQADRGEFIQVMEGGCRFLVNLWDYLDTGLFLDHRPIRLQIQKQAKNKHFLNLFCYTGSATIHAAQGGARSTTSVDMSRTYLDWVRKNLALNGFSEAHNSVVQADCFQWLDQAAAQDARFDMIFMDPPSFSNSKRMRDDLDIQRDHVRLIQGAVALLAEGGELIFSNNLRRFKMDLESLSGLVVKDMTPQTIDKDFVRSPQIHNCWRIHKA